MISKILNCIFQQLDKSLKRGGKIIPEYGIKNDKWIIEKAKEGMIAPFVESSISGQGIISFGTSSYGYDIRLSERDFRIFKHLPGEIVDPKNFNPKFLEFAELYHDENGSFFIIPGNSYGLGVAIERLEVPENVTILCVGKSTYARAGIICNLTPAEAGWKGNLTLEFSNSSGADAKLYANEGIAQLVFFEGEPCKTPYSARKGGGKYQHQTEQVTLARVIK